MSSPAPMAPSSTTVCCPRPCSLMRFVAEEYLPEIAAHVDVANECSQSILKSKRARTGSTTPARGSWEGEG